MLTQICLPLFADFSDKNFTTSQLYSWQTLSLIALTALGTIILTGIQPALQLSAFKPANVLQGNYFAEIGGKGGMRKALVIGQFACSAVLIMATLVVLNQLNFVREAKLGFEKEHIFTVMVDNEKLPIFQNELEKNPAILEVTASDHLIYDVGMRIGGTKWEGKNDDLPWQSWSFSAADNFKDFYNLEMAGGRWFRADDPDTSSFLLNETAAKDMKLENPVGKWMEFNGKKGHIIGVVKDFHFRSMHEAIEPLILTNFTERFFRIQIKTTGGNAAKAVAATEKMHREQLPDSYFKYSFVDEEYNKLYTSEAKTGKLFALFAGLAILISCLGIFGLAAFTAQRRTKEIGIRKVLGASFNSLILLLSKDFLKLVGIALFIAIPIAWWSMNDWLNNFAYRIEVEWWVFALTGLALGSIAFLTVSYQSVRAALVNPVESLRSE
ncbi:MAG: putative ABC transport system permease protein [Saprospiraceae bacterium]|jgi:putative ABC transport system permease protein